MVSILPTPPAPSTADLLVITCPGSSKLIVEPACLVMSICFASLIVTSMESPLPMVIYSDSLVVASIILSMSIMTTPQKTSPPAIVSSMLEVDFKDEVVSELLDSFYKSLR